MATARGDARRGAVLRPPGAGQMHMQEVERIVEAGLEGGEPARVRAHPRQRDLRRLRELRPDRPGDAERPAPERSTTR